MERKQRRWTIIGIFITFAFAGGWHFLYDIAPCGIVAALAPVNESPWEHAKLFFMPPLIWYAVQYFIIGKHFPNYVFAHSIALLVMPVLMLLLYCAYMPLVGESIAANLINSLVTIAAGAWISYRITVSKKDLCHGIYGIAALLIVLALLAVYTAFTFAPPHGGLFWDPSEHHYGLPAA